MNKNTVYVLQKDLPFAKAGVDFIRENEDADYYNTNFASYHDRLHKSRVENNPEWFKPKEQVNESKPTEQPLWEILSYINPNVVTDVVGGNIVYAKWSGAIYAILKNFPIHSVKRLRDNTVWIVDMVTGNGKITGFHIEKGIMVAEFENNTRHCDLMLLTEAPKEEQVPIKNTVSGFGRQHSDYGIWYEFMCDDLIPTKKYQSIKEAIEGVLNETLVELNNEQLGKILMSFHKNHSEELLQARRDAFDAAREVVGYSDALKNSPVTVGRKYKDNEDYINSLNK